MRKLFCLVSTLVVLVTFSAGKSHAQEVKPMMSEKQVTDLVFRVYDAPTGKFLSKQLNGPDHRGFRVVFVHSGKRYTLDHEWWVDGIQIWIRPNGTSHPSVSADVLGDQNTDGVVDFGSDGHMRIFVAPNYFGDGTVTKGLEHQPYWQKIYNEALAGLEATLHENNTD